MLQFIILLQLYDSCLNARVINLNFRHEILNRQSIIINRGIKKARIPFIILSIFIFAFEITFSTLRGLDLGLQNLMLLIMVIIYIVVSVGISIFYFITSIRVLLRMRTSTRTRHVHMKRVRSTAPSKFI